MSENSEARRANYPICGRRAKGSYVVRFERLCAAA